MQNLKTWQNWLDPLQCSGTDISIAGTRGPISIEVRNHLLLGQGFEGIETEAAGFKGGTGVRGDQLGVHLRGDREF